MASFTSGALNTRLFSSVTQNLFGFESSVARAAGGGWWPEGAAGAANLISGRYMKDGAPVTFADLFGFTRSTVNYSTSSDGTVAEYAINVPAINNRGLLLQPELTRLNANPANPTAWTAVAGAGKANQSAEGVWTPALIATGGNLPASYFPAEFTITSPTTVWLMARVLKGTSGNAYFGVTSATATAVSTVMQGDLDTLADATLTSWGNPGVDVFNNDFGAAGREIGFEFPPNATRTDARLRVGPYAAAGNIKVYGAQAVTGAVHYPDWVLGASPQAADVLTLKLPAYKCVAVLTFSNGETYQIYDVQGDVAIDAAALPGNRLVSYAYWPMEDSRLFIGDSYLAIQSYEWARQQDVMLAAGGSTPTDQFAVWNALSADLKALWLFMWDGGIAGVVGTTDYDPIITAKLAINNKLRFMTPTAREGLGAANDLALDIYEYCQTTYPAYFLAYDGPLLADPVTKVVPLTSMSDGTHPTTTRMEAVKAVVLPLLND